MGDVSDGNSFRAALAQHEAGQFEAAERLYRSVLRDQPRHPNALHMVGLLAQRRGRLQEAVTLMRRALELAPDVPEFHNNLGIALALAEGPESAIRHFAAAASLRPDFYEAHLNLANAMREAERLDEAETASRVAISLRPNRPEAHNALGVVLQERREVTQALDCFQAAIQLDPRFTEARLNRAMVLLLRGDWEPGWKEYEWRWKRSPLPPWERQWRQPRWDGSDPRGKTILLHAEGGFGDTIQFIRYAPLLAGRGARVIVQCPPQLVPLLRTVEGCTAVVARGQPLPAFDIQAPMMSLPGIWGSSATSIPTNIPYLTPDARAVERWKQRLPPASLRIGINWQCDSTHTYGRLRTIPLKHFGQIAEVKGVQLVSLAKAGDNGHSPGTEAGFSVFELDGLDESAGAFMDTATLMKSLDLVVSADTATAHLAGALGVPVWVGLRFAADWRWLLNRDTTPWYPSMRLFRQDQPGAWDGVFTRMALELRSIVPHDPRHESHPR